ncbi:MAG TPA: TolC family protein [Gemmata sp.]
MRPVLTASAFAALVLAATTLGQPPNPEPPKKAAKPAPTPTDAAIAAALANDPDVRMAQAKIQLAEAELAKARLVATLKVTALTAAIEQHKVLLDVAQKQFTVAEQQFKAGARGQAEFLDARVVLARAQAALAAAEGELKLLTAAGDASSAKHTALGLLWLHQHQEGASQWAALEPLLPRSTNTVGGAVADRLRAGLNMPVKLPKGEVTFEEMREVFKKAGLDVAIRSQFSMPSFVSDGEELTIGAWFQLYQDTAAKKLAFSFYVREYGLLITDKQSAPPDAPTLTEFWKQKPPVKPETKAESLPEPRMK